MGTTEDKLEREKDTRSRELGRRQTRYWGDSVYQHDADAECNVLEDTRRNRRGIFGGERGA